LQLVDEISTQRNLRKCGSIVQLLKIYETKNSVKMMLEYVNGGTLGNIIRSQRQVSEKEIRLIASQLLLTVDFMERKRILHRDLKPENVLVHISEDSEEAENKDEMMELAPNQAYFSPQLGCQDFSSKLDVRIADFGYAERITKAAEFDKNQRHLDD
jgi:serine/threonine protein kinase